MQGLQSLHFRDSNIRRYIPCPMSVELRWFMTNNVNTVCQCVYVTVCVCVSDPWQRQSHRQTIRHKVAEYTEKQSLHRALRSSLSWQILVSRCSRLISCHVLHHCCWWHALLVQVVGVVESRLSRGFPCRLTLGHILLVHATESSLEYLEPEQNANSYMS